jgi:uncharacterized protein with GYD domain
VDENTLKSRRALTVPRYIVLGNFAAKGIEDVAHAPNRDEAALNMIKQAGGKAEIYYTMGDYDFVAIMEMPDDDSMLKFLLRMDKMRYVVTRTMKAWNEAEFTKIVSQL